MAEPAGHASPIPCCIAGGGPAGMMLGYLMARAGVRTVVLEKHADFLRDFRGDTVHPSTLRIMDELGLLDEFLQRPHQRLEVIGGWFGEQHVQLGDFRGLPARYAFIAMMPQWEFLDFIADEARKLPTFTLRTRANVTGLIEDAGRVVGVRGTSAEGGDFEIRAELTVGCDGRHSTVRAAAGLAVEDLGAPIDVRWFRVRRDPAELDNSLARIAPGHFVVTIDRGDYWQCAFVIAKGGADALRARPIEEFRAQVVAAGPLLAAHIAEGVRSWDDVKLLTVAVDRLRQWSKPGLLCIGDAAHAMSPIGGVGINLAVQDAVAAARLLARPLRERRIVLADLQRVQQRREWPMKVVQGMQLAMQDRLIRPILATSAPVRMPWFLRLLGRFALLRRIPAWFIGVGVRPEHVER